MGFTIPNLHRAWFIIRNSDRTGTNHNSTYFLLSASWLGICFKGFHVFSKRVNILRLRLPSYSIKRFVLSSAISASITIPFTHDQACYCMQVAASWRFGCRPASLLYDVLLQFRR
jgi:hypothetical protein